MQCVQLKLETVTPMFLHGPGNREIELRPPPFKALFRYWWRAAVGEDADKLREGESNLFGNTKKRSLLSIRISGNRELHFDKYPLLPHKDRVKTRAYSPDSRFNLILAAPELNEYKKIAKLSFLLGGVGNRSRRGFGSIRYQDWSFDTVAELQDKVFQMLDGIAPGRFQKHPSKIQIDSAIQLPCYPVIRAIHFGDKSDRVNDLLCRIGEATHNHRDNALGSANRRWRMASPIHVRIQKVDDKFVPIVTQLNSVFPRGAPHDYMSKQKKFIAEILDRNV